MAWNMPQTRKKNSSGERKARLKIKNSVRLAAGIRGRNRTIEREKEPQNQGCEQPGAAGS